jgi:dTDP-4-amino-4,6-dideoxygalactose transaminase
LPDEEVLAALETSYADGSWGRYHGPCAEALIARLSELHASEHVTLCCSGTIAVELALRGLGVQPNDEVILAGYDFGGNFRAIQACGAIPVLVDVDADNWNLRPENLVEAVSSRTKAVIASHLHGGIVPMAELVEAARQLGIAVVEDACQAPGSEVQGHICGTWGDVGVLSFGGSKLLSAGRGGAVITNSDETQQRIRLANERGNQAFPMSELQAAVLLPQLEKLSARNAKRLRAAAWLAEGFRKLAGIQPLENRPLEDSRPGYFKLGLRYDPQAVGDHSRETLLDCVQAEGIALSGGFRDFSRRSPRRCRHVGSLTQSRRAGRNMLVLHHPVLLESTEVLEQLALGVEKVVSVLANCPAERPDGA